MIWVATNIKFASIRTVPIVKNTTDSDDQNASWLLPVYKRGQALKLYPNHPKASVSLKRVRKERQIKR